MRLAAALAFSGRLHDCRECRGAKLDMQRHCRERAEFPVMTVDGRDYYRCPVREVGPDEIEMLETWVWTRRGHLPEAGGLMDQDYYTMRMLDVISSVGTEYAQQKS